MTEFSILGYDKWVNELNASAAADPILTTEIQKKLWYNNLVLENTSSAVKDLETLGAVRKFMLYGIMKDRMLAYYMDCPKIAAEFGRFENYGVDFDPYKMRISCLDQIIYYQGSLVIDICMTNLAKGFSVAEILEVIGAEILTVFARDTLDKSRTEKNRIVELLFGQAVRFGIAGKDKPLLTSYVENGLSAGIALQLLAEIGQNKPSIIHRVERMQERLRSEFETFARVSVLQAEYPFLYELKSGNTSLETWLLKLSALAPTWHSVEHISLLSSVLA